MLSLMNDFSWVTVVDGLVQYQYPTEAEKKNVFTAGYSKFKKDVLRKHALTNDHCADVEGKRICCMQAPLLFNNRS